jgi:hypothetical protein
MEAATEETSEQIKTTDASETFFFSLRFSRACVCFFSGLVLAVPSARTRRSIGPVSFVPDFTDLFVFRAYEIAEAIRAA